MVEYDPRVIEKLAVKLYNRANAIAAVWALLFAFGGGFLGSAVGRRSDSPTAIILGVVILGAVGYMVGEGRAFHWRLLAQLALTQVEIERNTRPTTRAPS